jgi:hypothetical protein
MHDPDVFNRSEIWLSRARECRAVADSFRNCESRARMLKVARDFERMALEATEIDRAATGGPFTRITM